MAQLVKIALASLLVGLAPVLAQTDPLASGAFVEFGGPHDLLASDLMGADLYVSPTPVTLARVDELPPEWEQVARIGDLVIGSDGAIVGILADIGGFLGIGARRVMVAMPALTIVERAGTDAVFVVLNATRGQLETAPEYIPYMGEVGVGEPVGRVGSVDAVAGFGRVETAAITVDDLRNAEVYDRHNVRVADIKDVELANDGRMVAALIDVGGFLGIIGTRTVAIPIEQLVIHRSTDLTEVRVYLAITEEELLSLPPRED
ncbi:MAG: PRC-barrel domain-containing protein [Trueperaceae bacterium]|nr:PRC-barrel domain-containing protein [Trueperaceae bacterium]